MINGVSFLIHGQSKIGKSYIADTTPRPRLVLDAEGGNGTAWTPSRKRPWDPLREAPPVDDGSWDTAVVNVLDFGAVQRAYEWLNSGQHPFNSVTIDSIGETQQRCIDALVGVDPMKQQDWGELLRHLSKTVRDFRDLIAHPIRPIRTLVILAATRQLNGVNVPYVQGQLATTLPYYIDVIGYLKWVPDQANPLINHRFLMIAPDPTYLSGQRVGGRLGDYVHIPDHDPHIIHRMIDSVLAPVDMMKEVQA